MVQRSIKEQRLYDLRNFLRDLITPHNDQEREIFRQNPELIDEHCYLVNNMDHMTEEELTEEINAQLAPQGLMINKIFSDN